MAREKNRKEECPVALCSLVRIMHSVEPGDFVPLRLLSEKMVRNFDTGRGKADGGLEERRAYSPYGPYYKSNTHLARWYTASFFPFLRRSPSPFGPLRSIYPAATSRLLEPRPGAMPL